MDRERRGAPPDDIAVARPHAGRARCPHRSAATPRPRRPLPHIPCSLFPVTVSLPTTARWYWAVYVSLYVSLHLHASSLSPHTTFSSRAISSSVNSEKNARRRCASGRTRQARPSRRSGGRGGARGGRTRQARPSRRSGGRGGARGGRTRQARPSRRGGGRGEGRTDGARPSRRGEDGSRTSCRRGTCGRRRPFR